MRLLFGNYKSLTVLIILFSAISIQCLAQDAWIRKQDLGDTITPSTGIVAAGVTRWGAVAFSIGLKGYMGTGIVGSSSRRKDFWEYDPATDTWSQKATFIGPARGMATGFSIGNNGYIGCGDDNNATNENGSNDFYEYNSVTNKWRRRADFGGVPRRGAAGFSIGAKGYIGSGRINTHTPQNFKFKDFWEYDTTANSWTRIADLGGPERAFAVGFTIGNKGYVGTGHDYSGCIKDFWEYDPATGNWIQLKDFPGPSRYAAVGFSIVIFGYVGTGDQCGSYANDLWEFDPNYINPDPQVKRGKWSQKTSLPGSVRTLAAGFSIGNKGYIGTGQTTGGTNLKDFWEFTPSNDWAGTVDNNWNLAVNWTKGFVPDAGTNASIPITTNQPNIGSSAVCNNLTIANGAILTVDAGKSLTVSGALVNQAGITGLVCKSDALEGTGSLIHSTTGVDATIERFVSGDWASSNSGWHFISSPMANQSISNFTTSGDNNRYDLFGWDELLNMWINYTDGNFTAWNGGPDFNLGQGYLVSYEKSQNKTFSGNINVSDVTKTNLTFSNTGANYSWHLLGNPFSSALKWNDGNWALNHVAGTAKIWNEVEKGYSDIDANGIISSAEGFMISVQESNNSLIIPSISRVHSSGWYKSAKELRYLLLASEQDDNSAQESQIHINPSATVGFDFDYDSRFLQGYGPQFYSINGDEKLSTNSLPSLNNTDVIPFGFIKNQAENFKIELKETIDGPPVYLTDLQTDSTQNLTEYPVYKFTSTEGDDPARFLLHFITSLTSIQENKVDESFNIFQQNGAISISTDQPNDADIRVSNMLGQVVLQGKTHGKPITILTTSSLQDGIYLVTLTGNHKVKSKKLIINKRAEN